MQKIAQALTPDQVRNRLRSQGKTLTEWAVEHGYRRQDVYRVMGGQSKARFGLGHEIAVALGLKVPANEPSTPLGDRNTQQRSVA
ncbi:DNA-binding protein [Dyella lutea]|uniref:DNA-binding protein n=1 Tax=Dyella lutea TaxID=2950441 RepID=A0ABT1FDA0_9GAMM|nr:DNA-binding protein [Dyella lutea]MCP1375351.1 DNA-binding protein [Dyella lutea]